ncbi:MAG: lipase [Pirellulales bacterium]|nr:lipase [Pirellulales bacterium]
MPRLLLRLLLTVVGTVVLPISAAAHEPAGVESAESFVESDDEEPDDEQPKLLPEALATPTGYPNLVTPTLGGTQLWGDELIYGAWRIQQHAVDGHYRLLGPRDLRYAWGTYEQCQAKLDELIAERQLEPTRGRVVIVLHGLMRSRDAMRPLVKYLRKQSDYTVVDFCYPTTRKSVAEHAATLARVIDGMPEATELNFVGHSLGSIVVRHYLADLHDPASGRGPDPRIRRFVMLAPPNQGALLAQAAVVNVAFRTIGGKPARQISREWDRLNLELATPSCEFGVIAGGTRSGNGWNPLLPGDDDGLVRVDETRLDGAADFIVVPASHTFIMSNKQTLECTLRFLREGRFLAREANQP